MAGSHSYREEHIKQESLQVWSGDKRLASPDVSPGPADNPAPTTADSLTLSEEAVRRRSQSISSPQSDGVEESGQAGEDPRLMTMRLVLEALTGKKIKISSFNSQDSRNSLPINSPVGENGSQPNNTQRAGWGLEYDYHESYAKHEQMTFSAQGKVQTADGQRFSFGVQLAASNDTEQSFDLHLRAGDALMVDPLVINLNGQSVELSGLTVNFDLNSDGTREKIPSLKPGSGFLFLDRNNDGRATDGSELFGPASGNGFAELATLDSDRNGWLDDNDPLFKKLQIWTRDAAGTDYFMPLQASNIGAILLGHQGTPLSLNAPDNSRSGQITDTGVFLGKNGKAGTIQEIDLSI